MMAMTAREIDAFAQGHDRAQRNLMATSLWAVWNGAVFNGHALNGKRLPKLEPRLDEILNGGRHHERNDILKVVEHMRKFAENRNLPPPKERMN